MSFWKKKKLLKVNTFFFLIFLIFFFYFPSYDITFSKFFYSEGHFLSERYTLIKNLRSFFKDFMVFFSLSALFLLLLNYSSKKIKKKIFYLLDTN